jgi:hypothetical protein
VASLLGLLYLAAWVILGFFALRMLGRRYFHERHRADVAAAAIVLAFAAGTIWPYANRIGGSAADPLPTVAAPPPPPPTREHDVSAACTQKAPLHHGGVGSIDAVRDAANNAVNSGGSLPASDPFSVVGWAADKDKAHPAAAVCLVVDGKLVPAPRSIYGANRSDVATATAHPELLTSGFGITAKSGLLRPGQHHIDVAVKSNDGSFATLGGYDIIVR